MSGKRIAITFTVLLSLLLCISVFVVLRSVDGTVSSERRAIIILSTLVSDVDEEEKALAFHQYLLDEGYSDGEIAFLAFADTEGSDGIANISNIQGAFEDLISLEEELEHVVIYISDHEQGVLWDSSFLFVDGTIETDTLTTWMDSIDCIESVLVLNGNKSALAGPELQGSDRYVIASMDWDQSFNQDLFNITRGLKDQSADIDLDGEVSYQEAFLKECYNLRFEEQEPQLFGG